MAEPATDDAPQTRPGSEPSASTSIENAKGPTPGHDSGGALPRIAGGQALERLKGARSTVELDPVLQRTVLLGEDILRACLTSIMCSEPLPIVARLIRSRRDELMQETLLAYWSSAHGIGSLMGISDEEEKQDTSRLAELFKTYIAIVYEQESFDVVKKLVEVLIHDPNMDTVLPQSRSADESNVDQIGDGKDAPPRKRLRDGRASSSSSGAADSAFFDLQASFIPVSNSPPPGVPRGPGHSGVVTNPQTAEQTLMMNGGSFLYHLNNIAIQQRKKVTWKMASIGPPHMLEWHASLAIDDTTVGSGKGNSKQIAKEAAARQACYSLGWAVSAVG